MLNIKHRQKQATIKIGNDIIKIKVYGKTYLGNPAGFNVRVNDKNYFFNVLSFKEAFDRGYCKYVKENR